MVTQRRIVSDLEKGARSGSCCCCCTAESKLASVRASAEAGPPPGACSCGVQASSRRGLGVRASAALSRMSSSLLAAAAALPCCPAQRDQSAALVRACRLCLA